MKNGYSKSMTIQYLNMQIANDKRTIQDIKHQFNADDNDAYIVHLNKRINQSIRELDAVRKLVVDNVNIFN